MAKQKTDDTAASREEVRRRHKRRARLVMLRRLSVLALLVAIGLTLWKNWDSLAPDKLLARWQDSMNDRGDGYPISTAGIECRRLVRSQSYNVLLTDSHLIYYNDSGNEANRYTCTFSTPLLRQDGKYVLVAEQGGKRASLYTRSMELAQVRTEQTILAAAVNPKGQFALLTQGGQGFAVEVTVYNRKGEVLYTRSRGNLAIEVALADDGKELALLSTSAANGTLSTTIEQFSLSSSETQADHSYTTADVMLYRLQYQKGHRLMAIGDDRLYWVDGLVIEPIEKELDGKRILAFVQGDNGLALAVRPYGDTGGGELLVLNKSGTLKATVPFEGVFRGLSASSDKYLLLTDTAAMVFSASGAGKTAAVAGDGQQAVLAGNHAIVLGLSALQSYPLE